MNTKAQNIFLLSIPLFIAHGLEEYFNDFYHIDPSIRAVFGRFGFSLANTFLTFQVIFWLLLIGGFFLIQKNIFPKTLLCIAGLIILYEATYHPYKAIMIGGYYPGLYTALVFVIIGFLFWKELIKNLNI